MKKKIPGLNLIKIGLMIWILLFHAMLHFKFMVNKPSVNILISIRAVGTTGFFMISGFTLRYNYKEKLNNTLQVKKFFIGRLSTVYPMYIFMLLVAVLAGYRTPGGWKTVLLLPINIAMLQTFDHSHLISYFFNDNVWYVSTAFVLYLAFPLINKLLTLLSAVKKRARLIGSIIFMILFSEYLYFINVFPPIQNPFLAYYAHPLLRLPEFVVGIALYDLSELEVLKCITRDSSKILGIIACIVFLPVGLIWLNPYFVSAYNLYNIVFLPLLGVMILLFCSVSEASWINRLAENGVVKYITSLTFQCYLCQSFSIEFVHFLERKGWVEPQNPMSVICFLLSTLVFAIAAHHLIEIPGKQLMKTTLTRLFLANRLNT